MNIHLGKRSLFALGAIGGALLASAGVAFATGQLIGAGGVIQGCYRISEDDQKGQLRAVTDPSACRTNEAPISWNVQGPKGDKGDKGDGGDQGIQGPQGPPGPAGANGVSGYEIVGESRILDFLNVKTAVARCPTGKSVIGGGYRSGIYWGGLTPPVEDLRWDGPAEGGLNPYVSGPFVQEDGSNGFFVRAFNGAIASYYLYAYAICANAS
jgi:hypothetical protein